MPAGARISAGKVGQRAEIVAGERRLVGELHAGDLHAVAGIAGEADDDGISFFNPLCRSYSEPRAHWVEQPSVILSSEPNGLRSTARAGHRIRRNGRMITQCYLPQCAISIDRGLNARATAKSLTEPVYPAAPPVPGTQVPGGYPNKAG